MAFDSNGFLGGLGGLLGGLFGNSSDPYESAMQQYQLWGNRASGTQQPYLNAGNQAINDYQSWLKGQSDPTAYINSLMGNYKTSPYSQYLQEQSMRAAQNSASASGLTGSTPMMLQAQQNAANIASTDQNQWLQNILGINSQYGRGQQSLMQGGQQAANSLTNLYNMLGNQMAQAAYGQEAGENQDMWNMIGGLGGIIGSFF